MSNTAAGESNLICRNEIPEGTRSISVHRPIVLLSTLPRTHARRSGYPLLAEYLENDAWLTAVRDDPVGVLPWLSARVSSRFAFWRWYVGGSAIAEWNCARFLRRRPRSIVHMLWADNDLGFLDHYLALRGDWLCGTFHHCSDT